jgi:thioredoxin
MKEVLYFSAEWCVPCRQMGPIVEELGQDKGVNFRKVDTDDEYELAQEYRVRSVPTFVYLEDGKEISRTQGAQTGEELSNALSL